MVARIKVLTSVQQVPSLRDLCHLLASTVLPLQAKRRGRPLYTLRPPGLKPERL